MSSIEDRYREKYGKAISLLRKIKGLTQQELAQRCGVSHVFISQIERGAKFPSDALKEKIIEAFDSTELEFESSMIVFGAIPIDITKFSERNIVFLKNLRESIKNHFEEVEDAI